jgi:spore germination protein GerM
VPLLIYAVSETVGIVPPQFAALFQLPTVPLTHVLVALAEGPKANNKVTTIKTPIHFLILTPPTN